APDLFAGISAEVPFVDALTSILMPELPLTVIEWEEWGDPLHDPEVYEYMRSYSPYENVTEAAYPQILAVTSLNDTRVLDVERARVRVDPRCAGTIGCRNRALRGRLSPQITILGRLSPKPGFGTRRQCRAIQWISSHST
ncbi:Prolyl oligopeptidase family protein, partial [Brevibacterium aurantiacum]